MPRRRQSWGGRLRGRRHHVDHQAVAGIEVQLPIADHFLAVFRPTGLDVIDKLFAGLQWRRREFPKRSGLGSLLAVDPDFGVLRHPDADQDSVVVDGRLRRRGSRRRVDVAERGRAIRRSTIAVVGGVVVTVVGVIGVRVVVGVVVIGVITTSGLP